MVGDNTAVIPVALSGGDVAVAEELERARMYIRRAKADNTVRSYGAYWRLFCGWLRGPQRYPDARIARYRGRVPFLAR